MRFRLVPVDEGFFTLFSQSAENGAEAARRLRDLVNDIGRVSTTHTITGAIVGVGTSRRLSAVRWGIAGRVVWAWILTIPGAFLIAAVCSLAIRAVA